MQNLTTPTKNERKACVIFKNANKNTVTIAHVIYLEQIHNSDCVQSLS